MRSEVVYTLALLQVEGIGPATCRKLVEHYGSAEEVWKLSPKELSKDFGFKSHFFQDLHKQDILKKASYEAEMMEQNGIEAIFLNDEAYPSLLKQCPDAPPILFTKGKLNWNEGIFISVVGTRNCTSYGREFIAELMHVLQPHAVKIISGLAFGVDVEAHKKALEHNLPTAAVLAHGLKWVYPAKHRSIAKEILKSDGALVAEYSFSIPPERDKFLKRNRIIAGLSQLTIIVESAYGGGAMTTARYANAYGREVFALPGKITDKYSQGCNYLIKTLQAGIISQPSDVLEILRLKKTKKTKQTQLLFELDDEEKKVYELLKQFGKLHLEELSAHLNTPGFILLNTLLNLELKGVVQPLTGKYFELK